MPSPYQRSARHTFAVPVAWPRSAAFGDQLCHALAIAWPIGMIPWVPATWASLATAALCYWLRPAAWQLGLAVAVLFFAGSAAATVSERLLRTEDPRNVVVDELAGQALTFILVAATPMHAPRALAGFVCFRLFDILKPFPARQAERLPAGWGIMADDIVAGLYAAIVLYGLSRWI